MNIIDIIIIIILAFGAVLGFKRGFTKALVKGAGFIVVVILAFLLKNPLSVILYENLPFFKFGLFKGIEILNILIYEFIAFIIALAILGLILKLVIFATSIFEKLLNATIILGIPSKLAGAVVGIIENYVFVFVILYVLTLPFINIEVLNQPVRESKIGEFILEKTPVLSNIVDKSVEVVNEFVVLKDKYNDKTISEAQFNYDAIELFLKHKVVTSDSVQKLIDKGKISTFDNYNALLDKYREEKWK